MNRNLFLGLLVMIGFSLVSSSCSNNDDDGTNTNDNSAEIQQISNTVELGTWIITNFMDSGDNETNHFTGYGFSFNTNGRNTSPGVAPKNGTTGGAHTTDTT